MWCVLAPLFSACLRPEATSLFGEPLCPIAFNALQTESNELLYAIAETNLAAGACAEDSASVVWVGRRQAYAWNYTAAVATFSGGIAAHPGFAPLYRHRGHRYLTRRNFSLAEGDLAHAAALMDGGADEWEADGQPNAANVPLSTLQFNTYYHLGLARYLQADYAGALAAYERCWRRSQINDESIAATAYWRYMALRRLGRDADAEASLAPIHAGMRTLEGGAYLNLTMMFRGQLTPEQVLGKDPSALDLVTLGYGVAFYYNASGQPEKAAATLRAVLNTTYWAGFGFIAAEADRHRGSLDASTGLLSLKR